jgi:hypothetical protein
MTEKYQSEQLVKNMQKYWHLWVLLESEQIPETWKKFLGESVALSPISLG